MKKFSKSLLVVLLVVVMLAATACATTQPTENPTEAPVATEAPASAEPTATPAPELKIAVVFPGSIQDMGWNQSGYEAVQQLQAQGLTVSYQENVDTSALRDVLRSYASEGYNLIIGHDLMFTDTVVEVAAEFPDVWFGVSGGVKSASNVASVGGTNWESAYLAGSLAGQVTKSNKLGIIMAGEGDIADKMAKAFELGAQVYNPSAVVTAAYTGSWNDSVKAKEIVLAMAKDGIDIVLTQAGQSNVGAIEGAQEVGILAIGAPSDMHELAPDTVIASVLVPAGAQILNIVDMFQKGTLEGKTYILGVAEGAEDLSPYYNFEDKLTQEIKDNVQKVRQQLVDKQVPDPVA